MILINLWSNLSWAQKSKQDTLSVSAKIDSIYRLQQKMYKQTKNEPLWNKTFGIEFNFVRLLWMEKSVNLSGGFSLFSVTRQAEIAFPIYYSNPDDPKDLTELTIDGHFRYFLGNTQNGFYLSCFTRYAHLQGYAGENDEFLWDGDSQDGIKMIEDKLGIGVGIGYRKFSYKGIYWGFSLSFGRFIIGENNQFYGKFLSLDDDEKYIFDCEFFKFGWAF